ncbi:hypothetical protein GCM10009543_33260 [Leifsonia naganoensis]
MAGSLWFSSRRFYANAYNARTAGVFPASSLASGREIRPAIAKVRTECGAASESRQPVTVAAASLAE